MTQANSNADDRIEIRKGYYTSGALWWEIPYVNGKVHGIGKTYYESGALMREIPYVNGNAHGISKTYDKEKSNIECATLYERNREVLVICCESYKASLKPII